MMDKQKKVKEITNISELLAKSQATFLVDFKGLNVEGITQLRKQLYQSKSQIKVVRNTLAKLALQKYPDIEDKLKNDFVGTNALCFSYEDPSATAKILSDFNKETEFLKIKSGVFEGEKLSQDKIEFMATLPSKEVLRANFLGILSAPMSKFLRTLNEVPSGLVRLIAARKEKKE